VENLIREARPDDAVSLIAYVQRIANEPDIGIGWSPGEFNMTVEEEQVFVSECAASKNSIFLVAETENLIIGVLTIKGGARISTRHTGILGISVAKEWRNQGVGYRLMDKAVHWARETHLLSRIELSVFSSNYNAIHLYEEFGFVIEGCRSKAIFRDGAYHDDLTMALLFE